MLWRYLKIVTNVSYVILFLRVNHFKSFKMGVRWSNLFLFSVYDFSGEVLKFLCLIKKSVVCSAPYCGKNRPSFSTPPGDRTRDLSVVSRVC